MTRLSPKVGEFNVKKLTDQLISQASKRSNDAPEGSTWGEYQRSWTTEVDLESLVDIVVLKCIEIIQLGVTRDGTTTPQYLRSMAHIRDIKKQFNIKE